MEGSVEMRPDDPEVVYVRGVDAEAAYQRPASLSVRLLGPLRVLRGADVVPLPASRKARGLLAYLVMSPRPLRRSRICEVFWDVPNDPRGELRWCLSKLRGVLDEPGVRRVQAGQDEIAIDVATLDVDALRIEAGAEAAIVGTDVAALERLAALFDGVFLEGVVGDRTPFFGSWLAGRRERLKSTEARLLSRLCALLPPASEQRIQHLHRLVDLAPGDLSRHHDLLDALASAGRHAEVNTHIERAQRLLKGRGVDPEPLAAIARVAKRRDTAPLLPAPLQSNGAERESGYLPFIERRVSSSRAVDRPIVRHNLPIALSSYIQRWQEEKEIREGLAHHRLVTVVGMGGTGKTRLALEVGRSLLGEALDGMWLIELAGLAVPLLVGEALCNAIGSAQVDGRPAADGAAHFLRHKRAVVILDNCEHMVETVAEITQMLLRTCPGLRLLATSRERLGVAGESLYQVPGLSLPPAGISIDAQAARQHAAVRLFEERAKAVVPGFSLSDANAAAVSSICRMLDGLPMAIELVVPQLRMISPQGLVTRLKDRVAIAGKGMRGAVERHRTVRALFDWSYNLLDEIERALFRRLAIFTGGWTLETAVAVAADGLVAGEDIFALLSRLVEKSLVITDLTGSTPRYAFLETTRHYALDKLAESGELDGRDRLFGAMLDLCAAADATWRTTPTAIWLAGVVPDLDNIRSCLDWAFGSGDDAAGGVALCAYGLRIWDELALLPERERWFATAFSKRAEATPAPILARLYLGRLSNSAHGDRANFDLAWRAAELFRDAGDIAGSGEALARAGAALATTESTAEALPHLDEGLRLLKPLGPSKPLANCLRSLAIVCYFDHDLENARNLLSQSDRVARGIGDLRGVASMQLAMAELSFAAGDPNEAIAQVEAMLSGGNGNRRQTVLGLTNLVSYLLSVDRLAEARQVAREGLKEAQALDWRGALVRLIEHLALVSALSGANEKAAAMLGHGIAHYASGAGSREFTEIATFDRTTALLAVALPAERVRALMEEGAAWLPEQAIRHAVAVADGD